MDVDVDKWLWVDLEMTGLDPTEDRILEVAAIATDTSFTELARWQAVVAPNEQAEAHMKAAEWKEHDPQSGEITKRGSVYNMHVASGLMARLHEEGQPEADVQAQFAQFIRGNFDGKATLAGSSIHQDRRFIRQWWPDVEALLHYQMVDVSALKLVLRTLGIEYEKQKTHAALEDIEASIDELKFYLSHVKET